MLCIEQGRYCEVVTSDLLNLFLNLFNHVGIDQPDEDDYGYVSHEASELYKKLLDKYSSKTDIDPSTKYKMKTKSELNNAKVSLKSKPFGKPKNH